MTETAQTRIQVLDTRHAAAETYIVTRDAIVRVVRTFAGEHAAVDAERWAEEQKPRVDAAWRALTGGEDRWLTC